MMHGFPRLGQIGIVWHQHGGSEVIGQLDPQPRHAARACYIAALRDCIQQVAQFQQPRHMHQLEGAVLVIQRLGQQNLAPLFIILAQGTGQLFHRAQAHIHAQFIAQTALEGDVNLVPLDGY